MTKENKIQEVKQAIAKVAENRTYKLGDEVKAYGKFDTDGQRHSAKLAWRALALLQIELEKDVV